MLNVIYPSMTCFWKNILVGSGIPIIQALDTALGLVVDLKLFLIANGTTLPIYWFVCVALL